MSEEFKFDPTIDEYNLDQEWMRQPNLYHEIAIKLADAQKEFAEAKQDLEVTKSEIEIAIRKNYKEYGLDRLTNDAINAVTSCSHEVKTCQEAVMDARHNVDVLNAALHSLDHRKKALENLVSLFLSDYYSVPKDKPGTYEVREELKKKRIRGAGRNRDE